VFGIAESFIQTAMPIKIGRKNEKRMMTEPSYPPPPPPPPEGSRKMLIAAIVIVVIIAAVAVGAYYLTTTPSSTNPTPTPTSTPTSTPTFTPTPTPTSTPSGNNPIVNLRVGVYATYKMTTFASGTESTTSTLKMSVDSEETYNGTSCWVMSMTTETPSGSSTTKVVMTWWMSKAKLEVVHIRMQMYVDDVLQYEQEYDPDQASSQTGEPPEPVNPQTILSYETVIVPAGTFANCAKAESVTATTKADIWMHPDIPIWGIVKSETYSNSELQTKMELIAYGG
jgi:hypothetical protein